MHWITNIRCGPRHRVHFAIVVFVALLGGIPLVFFFKLVIPF